jgi:hypothetical protein
MKLIPVPGELHHAKVSWVMVLAITFMRYDG